MTLSLSNEEAAKLQRIADVIADGNRSGAVRLFLEVAQEPKGPRRGVTISGAWLPQVTT